jgi:adenine-specific DNA-methyltransferase
MATGQSKKSWLRTQIDADLLEDVDIRLEYPGKRSIEDVLNIKPADMDLLWSSNNPCNNLYFGDNLSLLAGMMHSSDIFGKVRLVYIDPPFSTRSVFKSRNQTDAYQDLLTGAKYVEFIRQRMIILRELLANDGSIYVHLDENMVFHAKIIMDEVFGRKNFRNLITRRKSSHKNYTRKTYGNVSDYILFYTKSDEYIWNRPMEEWTNERAQKEYVHIEPSTGRRYKKVPIHAPGVRNGATGGTWRGMLPPPGKHWQYTPDKLDEMDARGEIYWSPNGNPRRKIYLDQSEGVPFQDIWHGFRDAQNQNASITGYPTEKNPDMMAIIINASSNPGDLVLDCFAGSGTTLAVASRLGRRWLGIDNSQEALATMLRRFAHGTSRMGDFVQRPARAQVAQTLPMDFGDLSPAPQDSSVAIRDFALYAARPYEPTIQALVEDWRAWIV